MDEANLTKLKKEIAKAFKTINQTTEARAANNEDLAAIRQALAAKGIPKSALDMAVRYANMDEDKRKGWDAAFALCREAIGMPFDAQGDLFLPGDEDEAKQSDIED